MKFFLIPFFAFALISSSQAQNYCGSDQFPQEMDSWLRNYVQQHPETQLRGGTDYNIPIQFHLVGLDAGGGLLKLKQLFSDLCLLNEQYAATGFHFYFYDWPNYIFNNLWYNHDYSNGSAMMIQNNVDEVVNIYLVGDPAGNCGYYTWGPDAIAVANSCAGDGNSTIAHELGHYFSMPHTFNDWEGETPDDPIPDSQQEYMDGSNCNDVADYFCDTPPDYLSYRWPCPYNENYEDPDGTPIHPDSSLFMSYSYDECASRFSNQQSNAMQDFVVDSRDYLINQTMPPYVDLDTAVLLFPFHQMENVAPNYVWLRWKSIPGAEKYHLQLSRYNPLVFLNYDTLVEDTAILFLNLEANKTYRWNVKPVALNNVCADYTFFHMFQTTDAAALEVDFNSQPIGCNGSSTGTIEVFASQGTPPYQYNWSTGDTTPTISNLSAGLYFCTISDAAGDTIFLPVDVSVFNPISATIDVNGNVLSSYISGGNPPYTYLWSTGETTGTISILSTGVYFLTVTDENGCEEIINSGTVIYYNGIEDLNPAILSADVYPNPAQNFFTVKINSGQSTDCLISVFDLTGKLMEQVEMNLRPGENEKQIFISDLSNGIYNLEINTNSQTVNRKICVMK